MRFHLFSRMKPAAGWCLVVALLGVSVTWIAARGWRLDTTHEKLYTVSAETRTYLRALPRDTTLVFYASRHKAVPAPIRLYRRRIESLLKELARAGHGRLHVETVDPRPGSVEEQWADRLGLAGLPLSETGDGARLFLGLVARSGAREAVLPFLSPQMEPQIEYQVVRLIGDVSVTEAPRIGLMSPLPIGGDEVTPLGTKQPPGDIPRPAWTLARDLQTLYRLDILGSNPETIPDDLDALLVIHPYGLSERTLRMLDRYVVKGGSLVVFMDPLCLVHANEMVNLGEPAALAASDLNRLTSVWGATLDEGRIALDRSAATDVPNARGGVEPHPGWMTLRSENFNASDAVTSTLELMQIPFSGAFHLHAVPGLRATVLIQTSKFSGWVGTDAVLSGRLLSRVAMPAPGPLPLAVRIEGVFPTAFPDPAAPRAAAEEQWKAAETAAAPVRGQVILVGDVDLLHDRFAVYTDREVPGQTSRRPANSNLPFLYNLLEQVTGAPVLARLRNRARFDRPFTRVLTLARKTEEEARVREAALQQQLEEIRRKLRTARLETSDEPGSVLPARQDEVDRLTREEREAETRVFEVRHLAGREVEKLGVWIKGINLLAVPFAVAMLGIVHGVRRKRRSAGGARSRPIKP